MAVGIALFQDIAAIMLVAIMPQIFTAAPDSWETALNIGMAVLRGLSFWGAAWLIGRYLLPRIMLAVARTKSRELFTLMVFAICSGIAMLASLLGLSIALGAFTAGLFVSSSYYSHRVLSEVLPFKDLFLTIFFVSAGLLIDIDGLWEHIGQVATFASFVLAIKFVAPPYSRKLPENSRAHGHHGLHRTHQCGDFPWCSSLSCRKYPPSRRW